MIIYFSTVVRMAPLEQGGELVKLDWDKKQVIARVPIIPPPPMKPNPNPRGGARGGRGILIERDHVYVASYHTIHVFDRELRPIRQITNPLFSDIHEIDRDDDGIWVSSTAIDAAIKVDPSGATLDSWWPREDPLVSSRFGLPPLSLDKEADNRLAYFGNCQHQDGHTHLNAVFRSNGSTFILLNSVGGIIQTNPTRIFVEDPNLRGSHNILVTQDGQVIVNDTQRRAVAVYDPSGALLKRINLDRFHPVQSILRRYWLRSARLRLAKLIPSFRLSWYLVRNIVSSRPIFVRGLCQTDHGTILVGISPASILEIDWSKGELVDHYCYARDVNVAIHGLKCTNV